MKCKLHYVEFRGSSSKTGPHLRKGKLTWPVYHHFEVVSLGDIPTKAQALWDEIVAEGKEVEFRRIEVYALDWRPTTE